MSETRDLVEARAVGRRRVVAAFASATPDGRSPPTARLVAGGLVLAALLAGGATAAGLADGHLRLGSEPPAARR